MIRKAILGTVFLFGVMFVASGSTNAQARVTPGEMCGLLGVGGPCKGTTPSTSSTTTKARYSDQQVAQMYRQIDYFNSQLGQWVNYRDQVARYWNDPTYYQWARNEYNKAIGWVSYYQKSKSNYEQALRNTGQL